MRNKREKLLLVFVLLAVAILAGDRLVLGPLVNSWQTRAAKIIELERNVGNGKDLLPRGKSNTKTWERYWRDNLNNTNSVAEDEVLRAIENWTGDSGILLTSVKPQWQNHEYEFLGKEIAENKTYSYKTYDVRLVAEGTMQEAVEFVHAIESDELPLKIEQLELLSREKTGKLISVSVHFTGLQLGEALQ
ncbi:MAG: hypothetical protein OSB55_01535 [Verrucomicrobiota bacterium]|nr:hypothetical protein [Verrucomicrobiota bacterium]